MREVQFTRGISLNGTWYKKDKNEIFDKKTADALKAKGIVKDVPAATSPAKKKEEKK